MDGSILVCVTVGESPLKRVLTKGVTVNVSMGLVRRVVFVWGNGGEGGLGGSKRVMGLEMGFLGLREGELAECLETLNLAV